MGERDDCMDECYHLEVGIYDDNTGYFDNF